MGVVFIVYRGHFYYLLQLVILFFFFIDSPGRNECGSRDRNEGSFQETNGAPFGLVQTRVADPRLFRPGSG
jgi:hypothetical protein